MTSSTRRERQRDDSRVLMRMPGRVFLLPVAVLARPVVSLISYQNVNWNEYCRFGWDSSKNDETLLTTFFYFSFFLVVPQKAVMVQVMWMVVLPLIAASLVAQGLQGTYLFQKHLRSASLVRYFELRHCCPIFSIAWLRNRPLNQAQRSLSKLIECSSCNSSDTVILISEIDLLNRLLLLLYLVYFCYEITGVVFLSYLRHSISQL